MNQEQHTSVGYTSTELIFEDVPSWLRVIAPSWVNCHLHGLATSYFQLVMAMLEQRPPQRAHLHISETLERMSFNLLIAGGEEDFSSESHALRGVAKRFKQLSVHILQGRKQSDTGEHYRETNEHKAGPDQTQRSDAAPVKEEVVVAGHGQTPSCHPQRSRLVAVFKWPADFDSTDSRKRGRDEDSSKRLRQLLLRLAESGAERPLRNPPLDWAIRVDRLALQFPNFQSIIETVARPHLALSAMGMEHRFAPVLLVGPPGVGKTYFANALAETLGVGAPIFVPMASETNGSSLAGSSTFWSNSAPGTLFDALAWGLHGESAVANPLIVLDEIDKVNVGQHNPLGALYSLLEIETARRFQDQSVPDVVVDASRIRFIATANDLSLVPEALISRMLVIHVEQPNRHQLESIIQSIFSSVLKRLGVTMEPELAPAIVEMAIAMSPRAVKVRLECAIAQALSQGRNRVDARDWPSISDATNHGSKRTIGFTA